MIEFKDLGVHFVKDVPSEFFDMLRNRPLVKNPEGNQGGRRRERLKDVVTAFDIETTRLHDYTPEQIEDARRAGTPLQDDTVMYIWQWCWCWKENNVYNEYVVYGRTWKQFIDFTEKVWDTTSFAEYVVYVHNLAYEFQFIKAICLFETDNVFSIKSRQPLKASSSPFQFRCSYKQSNMSLRKFAENMQTPHQKTELNYTKKRYWYTPLNQKELEYCVNDVYCLVEAIVTRMEREGDTLRTIPFTSTGYVRRDVKRAVREDTKAYKRIHRCAPSFEIYSELKEAFRGGNTHANRFFSNELLKGVVIHSADRSSSYPAVICNAEYPFSKWQRVSCTGISDIIHYMKDLHRAILARIELTDVHLKDDTWGCPYISISKCRNHRGAILDNGRVLSADRLEMTVTDVDLKILFEEYDLHDDNIRFFDVYSAKYEKIPKPIINKTIEYYEKKTSLKGLEDMVYYYMKNKNLLNSIYGMMVQDLVKILIKYIDGLGGGKGEFVEDPLADPLSILKKSEKKSFLSYSWGIWVTAHARYELERGIRLVHETPGAFFIYCDTDSVKYIGDVDWTKYNTEKINESMSSGSHATDPKGTEHYMGVFEQEHDMDEFITMGAKKYAFHLIEPDKHGEQYFITVAGVGKSSGMKQLMYDARHQGIDDPLELFKEGYTFHTFTDDDGTEYNPGGLEAVYNDYPAVGFSGIIPTVINEEGRPCELISNVTLRPSTYTLGLTQEYRELIEGIVYEKGDDLFD